MSDKNIEKLNKATKKVMQIISEKIITLPYFNDKNLNINKNTLKKILVEGEFLPNGVVAIYITKTNTIYIQKEILENITEEKLVEILLHEFIHYLSANLETKIVGFDDKTLPTTYNEALTQWLTLKSLYENMQQALETNIIYPESVIKIDNLINNIGEYTIFNGYFENDIKKSVSQMNKDSKALWLNSIMELFNSKEEKISIERLNELENKVNNSKSNK